MELILIRKMTMKSIQRLVNLFALLLLILIILPAQAQQPPPKLLILHPTTGLATIPIMEGWFANEDGSVTISFGFSNRNEDDIVTIPFGENNYIEPAQFDGLQPTHFDTGRHVGVFTVTLPPERRSESIWWYLRTGNGELLKVPGRAREAAYELDRRPRPQGSVQPIGWFEENGVQGTGPEGFIADAVISATTDSETTLIAHAKDPSVRDPNDPRFGEPLSVRLHWFKHQGPGDVVFSRHESTPEPEAQEPRPGIPARFRRGPPGPEVVTIDSGEGSGKVVATFSEQGEYLMRILVENWRAPDSSAGNQCCWTNIYQRVLVAP